MCDISLGIFTGVVFWLTTKKITKFSKKKKLEGIDMCDITPGNSDEREILTCVNSQLWYFAW